MILISFSMSRTHNENFTFNQVVFKIDFSIFSDDSINPSALIRVYGIESMKEGSIEARPRKFLKAHQKRIAQTHPHQIM